MELSLSIDSREKLTEIRNTGLDKARSCRNKKLYKYWWTASAASSCPRMSTPQVMSMKHIHQRLASFLRFIHLRGITSRKLCTALFRRLVLSLRFLLSRCQILCEKQLRRVSLSSLGLTKPRIDEEFGSTINANGQSQVSGGLNDHSVYAYFVAHYWILMCRSSFLSTM